MLAFASSQLKKIVIAIQRKQSTLAVLLAINCMRAVGQLVMDIQFRELFLFLGMTEFISLKKIRPVYLACRYFLFSHRQRKLSAFHLNDFI